MTSDQIDGDNISNDLTAGVADSFETTADFGAGPRPSECVIDALSEATGVDALSLPPLHGAIDPEALDALVRSTTDNACVSFDYRSLRVDVSGDGDISVWNPTRS